MKETIGAIQFVIRYSYSEAKTVSQRKENERAFWKHNKLAEPIEKASFAESAPRPEPWKITIVSVQE